jgi:hypothetical protein
MSQLSSVVENLTLFTYCNCNLPNQPVEQVCSIKICDAIFSLPSLLMIAIFYSLPRKEISAVQALARTEKSPARICITMSINTWDLH